MSSVQNLNDPHDPEVSKTGLFLCRQCKVIEPIPSYDPVTAHMDPRIDYIISSHNNKHPSTADRDITQWASLGFVPTDMWESPIYHESIRNQILAGNNVTGFEKSYYDLKDTLTDDAYSCFQSHGRPSYEGIKCLDYRDSSKLLSPGTNAERRELNLPTHQESGIGKRYLCDHCPYQSTVQTEINWRKGRYK